MKLGRVLIVDTETDGIGPEAVAVEVACILYDVGHAAAVVSFASLLQAPGNAAAAVNGIPPSILVDGPDRDLAWQKVVNMRLNARALVAHNAEFDKRFVPEFVQAHLPWICTMDDLAWPRASDSRSLVALALAHGVGVASAHRALTDCDLIARLFTRVHEMGVDLETFLARGLRPKAMFAVVDGKFDEARNKIAYEHGFRFNRDRRLWLRSIAIEDADKLPFSVRRVS